MQQYELTPKELRQVQKIQLELLEQADQICRKNNIPYNIIAGTLLGAVRHRGFIPWDDDADVALMRRDYEIFREACKKDLDHSKYYFQDHANTRGYRWGYGKLRRRHTLFLRKNQAHMPYEQGIFIDIFPLDPVPKNYILRFWHNFHCFCIRKAMWAPVGMTDDRNVWKRLGYRLLSEIPEEWLFSHYDKFVKKCSRFESEWVRILTYPTPTNDYGYLRRWYESRSEIEFEGDLFYTIKERDEYLRFKFGEYWVLPEEKERKTHPIIELKLLDRV